MMLTSACSDNLDESNRKLEESKANRVVANQDFVSTNRRDPLIIDVLANDEYNGAGSLNIVQFSQPRYGTVSLNGDRTLTFDPGTNIPSGKDSFAYTVLTSGGVQKQGEVSITIVPSWGKELLFEPTDYAYSYFSDRSNNFYIFNGGTPASSRNIKQLDSLTGIWKQPVDIISKGEVCNKIRSQFLPPDGDIFLFCTGYNTAEVITYTPTANQIRNIETIFPISENNPQGVNNYANAMQDELGNIMVIAVAPIFVNGAFSHKELWGRWYSARDALWLPRHVIFGENQNVENFTGESTKLFVSGSNAMVILSVGKELFRSSYDLSSNKWTVPTPLVTGTANEIGSTTISGKLKRIAYSMNLKGEVVAVWVNKNVTNLQSPVYSIQSRVFHMVDQAWSEMQQVAPPETANFYSVFAIQELYPPRNLITTDNGNMTLFWKKPDNSIIANTYISRERRWLTETAVSPAYDAQLDGRPSFRVYADDSNSLTTMFVIIPPNTSGGNTAPSTLPYKLWSKRMSASGTWTTGADNIVSGPKWVGYNMIPGNNGKMHLILTKYEDDKKNNLFYTRYEFFAWTEMKLLELQPPSVGSDLTETPSITSSVLAADEKKQQLITAWTQQYKNQDNLNKYKLMLNRANAESGFTAGAEESIVDDFSTRPFLHKAYLGTEGNIYLFWRSSPSLDQLNYREYWFKDFNAGSGKWNKSIGLVTPSISNNSQERTELSLIPREGNKFILFYNLIDDNPFSPQATTQRYIVDYQ